jgi:EAL domain-containing protein (putative c-di-GMP-specific phosphodiesterase class I)
MEQAALDALRWPKNLRISFNIAPCQLVDTAFALQLLRILGKIGLSFHRLELELTEEALVKNAEDALLNIQFLKGQGVTIALDDFGTGYASLHHLRLLPFHLEKIDWSFVKPILTSESDRRMIAAAIDFTHALGIPILAEGVENSEQADVLRALGCDFAQGWFFGRACSAEELLIRNVELERASAAG